MHAENSCFLYVYVIFVDNLQIYLKDTFSYHVSLIVEVINKKDNLTQSAHIDDKNKKQSNDRCKLSQRNL